MADRYQQLINTPVGRIVTKQVGLPAPIPLERYEPGQPVISGPVLLGAGSGGVLGGPAAKVLAAVGAEARTPLQEPNAPSKA
jgi:3-oxoacyl-[acyl-carrier protein] reductase